uniref:Uncharacterized protein n=1 Tax=Rhizophora mucronata TaxID=61149 RepID=A0A2P2N2N5_RHIMU
MYHIQACVQVGQLLGYFFYTMKLRFLRHTSLSRMKFKRMDSKESSINLSHYGT